MHSRRVRLLVAILTTLLIVALCNISVPSQVRLPVGRELKVSTWVPVAIADKVVVRLHSFPPGLARNADGSLVTSFDLADNTHPVAALPGRVNLELRLFDLIPVKRFVVDVVEAVEVVPGGQSIGVLLGAGGVLVIGYAPVEGERGEKYWPAKKAGLRPGDLIIDLNGSPVNSDLELARLVDELGSQGPIRVRVRRNGETIELYVEPRFCAATRRYRLGIYVRDSAAGIGTLTFYDPRSRVYGALGHMVCDSATGQKLELGGGQIVRATVQSIQMGRSGRPGEKIGTFSMDKVYGSIEKNTKYGIFGRLNKTPEHCLYYAPVPVALAGEVKRGPAEMLTVVDGDEVRSFQVYIENVLPWKPDGKGLVIKVTDSQLISLTGGIVQGMSGSPLIQDGRLIGAVTHVFVNDPSRGYGVLAEWMAVQAGLMKSEYADEPPGSLFLVE